MKRILALVLALLMVFSLAACTTNNSGKETGATYDAYDDILNRVKSGDTTMLSIYPNSLQTKTGILSEGYAAIGKWLKDTYNLDIEVWAQSDERTTTILASGDLPDIMYLNNPDYVNNAIGSNQFMNLESYIDSMPSIAKNEGITAALDYTRQFRSNETGELYVLPTSVGWAETSTTHVSRHRVFTWWDYFHGLYGKTGAPDVDDPYKLIDIMKEMIAAYPVDDDGTATYGTLFYYGGSNQYAEVMQSWYYLQGYTADNLRYMIESDAFSGTNASIFADNSKYYQGVKFFNAIYQAGLLDPDSINYDRATAQSRAKEGYYMMWFPAINTTDNDDIKTLYTSFSKHYYSKYSDFGSSTTNVGISAKTTNLDACLVLLNSFATPNEMLIWRDGPAGERWDYAENGELKLVDSFIDVAVNGGTYTWTDGTEYKLVEFAYILDLGEFTTHGDGQTYTCDITKWKIKDELTRSENDDEWTAMYGYDYIQPMLVDKNQIIFASDLDALTGFCAAATDEQLLVIDSCSARIIESTWKMIYAETDADFEQLWNTLKSDCLGLGAQDIIDWRLAELDAAKAIKAELLG